jgi:hypothetical protein
VLLHVQRSGDSGSPRVIGSTRFFSAGYTSGCAISYGRLPALRRTLTTSAGVAPLRASSRPLAHRADRHAGCAPAPRPRLPSPSRPLLCPPTVDGRARPSSPSTGATSGEPPFSAPAPTSTLDHVGLILSIPASNSMQIRSTRPFPGPNSPVWRRAQHLHRLLVSRWKGGVTRRQSSTACCPQRASGPVKEATVQAMCGLACALIRVVART